MGREGDGDERPTRSEMRMSYTPQPAGLPLFSGFRTWHTKHQCNPFPWQDIRRITDEMPSKECTSHTCTIASLLVAVSWEHLFCMSLATDSRELGEVHQQAHGQEGLNLHDTLHIRGRQPMLNDFLHKPPPTCRRKLCFVAEHLVDACSRADPAMTLGP
jgi:hypothetical protein